MLSVNLFWISSILYWISGSDPRSSEWITARLHAAECGGHPEGRGRGDRSGRRQVSIFLFRSTYKVIKKLFFKIIAYNSKKLLCTELIYSLCSPFVFVYLFLNYQLLRSFGKFCLFRLYCFIEKKCFVGTSLTCQSDVWNLILIIASPFFQGQISLKIMLSILYACLARWVRTWHILANYAVLMNIIVTLSLHLK